MSTTFKNLYYFDSKIHVLLLENLGPRVYARNQDSLAPSLAQLNSHEMCLEQHFFI